MYTSGISLGERGQLDASLSNINNPPSSPSVTPSAAGTMAPNKESTASGSKGGDRQQSVEPGEAQADALRDDPNTFQRIKVCEPLTSNLNFGLDVMSVVCNGSKSAARRVLNNESKEFLPSRFVHACNRVLANVHPMQATVEEHLLALGMEGVVERQAGIVKRLEQVEENSLPKLRGDFNSLSVQLGDLSRALRINNGNQSSHVRELEHLSSSAKDVVRRLAHLEEAQRGPDAQGLFTDQSNSLHSVLGALRGGVGNITSALQRIEQQQQRLLQQQQQPAPSLATACLRDPPAPVSWADAAERSEEEENAAPAIPPVSSKKDHVKPCKMAQPSQYNGSEDVDEALYTFETYFDATKAPKEMWPKMVLMLLGGQAKKAWLAFVVPRAESEVTWDSFCKCMHDSFAPPDKHNKARMQLKNARQGNSSVKDYIRHVRSLITQLGSRPPAKEDALMFLYDGLNKETKNSARADPRTGQAWTDFDALANYLITVEISSGTSDASTPHSNARFTRKFKTPSTPHVAVSQCKPYVTAKGKVITDRQQLFQIARAQEGNSRRPAIGGGKRGPGGQHSGPPPPKKRGGADHRAPAPHHVPVPGGFDLAAFAKEAAENAVKAFTEKGMGK